MKISLNICVRRGLFSFRAYLIARQCGYRGFRDTSFLFTPIVEPFR